MDMQIFTTDTGIRAAVKRYPSEAVYCAVSMDCGTRDESKGGLVHFIEHMLFKGTSRRSAKSINNRIESGGGELNAYTSKEDLVVYSTVLKSDMHKALDLIFELVFDSVFPGSELEKERGVIEEEIKSYKDNPSDAICDRFEELLFAGHALSRPILGTEKSLKTITSADMSDFAERFFVPSNIVVSVLGDVSAEHVRKVIDKAVEKYCKRRVPLRREGTGCLESTECPDGCNGADVKIHEYRLNGFEPFRVEQHKRIHQGHVICGTHAFNLYDDRRIPFSLLVNMLGGPALNSALNRELREKRGLVYTVEANYTPFKDTGMFNIYLGCDKSNIGKCEDLVLNVLGKFTDSLCSARTLGSAKRQFMGQVAISNDNLESQVLGMGKSLMAYNRINTTEEIKAKIEQVSPDDIFRAANDVFGSLNWLIYK